MSDGLVEVSMGGVKLTGEAGIDAEEWRRAPVLEFGEMISVGVADDRDDNDAELISLDFIEDERALDGIEPPLL